MIYKLDLILVALKYGGGLRVTVDLFFVHSEL